MFNGRGNFGNIGHSKGKSSSTPIVNAQTRCRNEAARPSTKCNTAAINRSKVAAKTISSDAGQSRSVPRSIQFHPAEIMSGVLLSRLVDQFPHFIQLGVGKPIARHIQEHGQGHGGAAAKKGDTSGRSPISAFSLWGPARGRDSPCPRDDRPKRLSARGWSRWRGRPSSWADQPVRQPRRRRRPLPGDRRPRRSAAAASQVHEILLTMHGYASE